MSSPAKQQAALLNRCTELIRPVVREAIRQGWTLTRRGKGHPMLESPEDWPGARHRIPVSQNTKSAGMAKHLRKQLQEAGVVFDA